MTEVQEKKMLMSRTDHETIMEYLKLHPSYRKNPANAHLFAGMETAELVDDGDFPWDAVKLHTKVIIRDKIARLNYTYIVVLPEDADHKKCMVSIFSPIGSALFGKQRGEDLYWLTAKGKRFFTVMATSQLAV